MSLQPLDLKKVRVYPLSQRKSLSSLDRIRVDPETTPPPCPPPIQSALARASATIRNARSQGASVILMYGAHLIKNGAFTLVNRLVDDGWITHLATNGAGTIHDWELSFFGRTEESVRENVATGSFGTWDETGRYIALALLAGGLANEGYGRSLGRLIHDGAVVLPSIDELQNLLRAEPAHPLAPARAELLQAMTHHKLPSGRIALSHPHKQNSLLANAFSRGVPFTVHPGIGYDIIATHPMFSGAAVGRAAAIDFALFSASVDKLDQGVVLSIGSAIMAPQVFEKSLSCVNNLRIQSGRSIVRDHTFHVVDIQDGGNWDWSKGEPPKDNPAYYLRFCKTYARMGGELNYSQCDNVVFLHNLLNRLRSGSRE